MNEQAELNLFLNGLDEIFRIMNIKKMNIKTTLQSVGDYFEYRISSGANDEILITSDGCELTVCFGQSHWHINTYSHPLDIDSMKLDCISSVMGLINSKLLTYSAWHDDKCLGGSSMKSDEDVIKNAIQHFPKANSIKVQSFGSGIQEMKISAQQADE